MAQEEQTSALKTLLGITDVSKEPLLGFLIDKATEMICNYCYVHTVPLGLENVLLSLCVDLYRTESLGKEKAEGDVKKISEGDVSVSFNTIAQRDDIAMVFLRDYITQLNCYRKARW